MMGGGGIGYVEDRQKYSSRKNRAWGSEKKTRRVENRDWTHIKPQQTAPRKIKLQNQLRKKKKKNPQPSQKLGLGLRNTRAGEGCKSEGR